jgi:hypothetical protein
MVTLKCLYSSLLLKQIIRERTQEKEEGGEGNI